MKTRNRTLQPQQRRVNPKTGRLYRIVSSPPPELRKAKLDNLVLVPASLLPLKGKYQAIANQQPRGTTLVVLPSGDSPPRRTLERVIGQLRSKGQPVRIMTTGQAQVRAL